MTRLRHAAWAFAALLALQAAAQSLRPAPLPAATIEQRLGTELPMNLPLTDEAGSTMPLRAYFAPDKPVLLMLGYHRCPQLCGLLMHGVLDALHAAAVSQRDVRLLNVSIDPDDTPATARARRDADMAYAAFLLNTGSPGTLPDLHLLTGSAEAISRLAREVGFVYQRTPSADEPVEGPPQRYAHAATVIVVTPQGRVSRYLMGIRFDPDDMRQAIAEASRGGVGTLSDRLALLCAHLDLQLGRHSTAVMNATRTACLLIAAALGAWAWRRRTPARKEPPR